MWHMARDASSIMSALCSLRSICTSSGTKMSTERAAMDSSEPIESSSHSSDSAASCRPSSSAFMPERMFLRRE